MHWVVRGQGKLQHEGVHGSAVGQEEGNAEDTWGRIRTCWGSSLGWRVTGRRTSVEVNSNSQNNSQKSSQQQHSTTTVNSNSQQQQQFTTTVKNNS